MKINIGEKSWVPILYVCGVEETGRGLHYTLPVVLYRAHMWFYIINIDRDQLVRSDNAPRTHLLWALIIILNQNIDCSPSPTMGSPARDPSAYN